MPELALVRSTAVAMAMQLVFGMITLAVGAFAIKWLDRLAFRHLDLEQEIAKGNLAAAVLAGTIWIALAIILGHGG